MVSDLPIFVLLDGLGIQHGARVRRWAVDRLDSSDDEDDKGDQL